MDMQITQDAMGTHMDWKHEGVTPHMIDWFWSNLEKAVLLWHPEQHEPLVWAVPVTPGDPRGSVHIAPQTWNDGTRQNLYIRFEKLEDVPAEVRDYIVYEHVVIVGGLGFGPESMAKGEVFAYRIHQWEKTDYGVVGKSSAIDGKKKATPEEGMIWAAHCGQEIGNWGVFLPQLYELYKVVKNPLYNPFADLAVEGKGRDARFRFLPQA
ncbi:MAG: hypothetical protein H6Q00_1693 [Holophagaceae bacterium]|nr:hypothetical protein [Holophagaceae bacterium]